MKTLVRVALFVVASTVGVQQTNAQTLDPTFAAINILQPGSVNNALQQPDGKYLVGGNFTQVNGSPAVGLARLNTDGTLDQAFTSTAACQSSIQKIRLLPSGQLLLQGFSIIVGGRTFSTLAKLNTDGTVVTSFSAGSGATSPTNIPIVADVAVQADGKILVSGSFTGFNGVATNNLVRLNADGSVDQAFVTALAAGFTRVTSPSSLSVRGVEVQPDGKIIVCGNFENYNSTGRSGLVRLNTDGSLDTGFNPVSSTSTSSNAEVLAVALDPRTNSVLVYGNTFNNQQIVRLTPNGQVDASFSVAASPNCLSFSSTNSDEFVVDANGRVLVSSCFADYGAANGNSYVTRFLANGQPDLQFAIGRQLDGRVVSVQALANGDVLLGGAFGRYGTIRNVNLVRLNDNAQPLSTFRPVITQRGNVQDMARQADGKLVVAGRFWEINGQPAGNLARLNPDGTLDSSFQLMGTDGQVRRIAVQPDGRLVVGGEFTTAAGQASPVVARLLPNGSADASFTAPAVSAGAVPFTSVSALALQADGRILVGGPRLTIGGFTSTLHRLLPNGILDVGYASQVGLGVLGGQVMSILALPNGKQYIGGLSSAGTTPLPGLVRLNADGSRDNAFATSTSAATTAVNDILELPNNQVLVGGSFSSYGNTARTNLVRLQDNGSVDMNFTPPVLAGSVVQLARYTNGRVLLASNSLLVNGTNRGGLVRLNPDGAYDASFAAAASLINVTALELQPNESIVIAGGFTTINNQPRTSLARLTAPNVLAVSNRQRTAKLDAWPNPVQGQLHVSLDAAAKPRKLVLLDAVGKVVFSEPAIKTELTLPIQNLPAGVYLLRVDYADGPVTRRVVVE